MGETRTKSMRVRVTPGERATIDSRARAAGYESSSEFVRALALGSASEPAPVAGAPAPAVSSHAELEARFKARFAELRKAYPHVVARRMANREVYGGTP